MESPKIHNLKDLQSGLHPPEPVSDMFKGAEAVFLNEELTGTAEFNLVVAEQKQGFYTVFDPEPLTSFVNRENFYCLTLLNSGLIPEELISGLAKNPDIREMAARFPIDPAELLFYAIKESDQQTFTLAIGENGNIGMVAGLILAEQQYKNSKIKFLYTNAIATHPNGKGLYGKFLERSGRRYPIQMFGGSTNEVKLPEKWKKTAKKGMGYENNPWQVYPDVKNGGKAGELITFPDSLINIVENFRSEPDLNLISGTQPDFARAGIRFGQSGGIVRPWDINEYRQSPVYSELIKNFGFNPGNSDQMLFMAVSPELDLSNGN